MIQSSHRFCLLLRRQICLNPVWRMHCEARASVPSSKDRRLSASEAGDRRPPSHIWGSDKFSGQETKPARKMVRVYICKNLEKMARVRNYSHKQLFGDNIAAISRAQISLLTVDAFSLTLEFPFSFF